MDLFIASRHLFQRSLCVCVDQSTSPRTVQNERTDEGRKNEKKMFDELSFSMMLTLRANEARRKRNAVEVEVRSLDYSRSADKKFVELNWIDISFVGGEAHMQVSMCKQQQQQQRLEHRKRERETIDYRSTRERMQHSSYRSNASCARSICVFQIE